RASFKNGFDGYHHNKQQLAAAAAAAASLLGEAGSTVHKQKRRAWRCVLRAPPGRQLKTHPFRRHGATLAIHRPHLSQGGENKPFDQRRCTSEREIYGAGGTVPGG
ncbi:unnamed protein product, partial [Ectocarpus sp. 12 AP-2014]